MVWSEKCQNEIKKELISDNIMAFPDFKTIGVIT
jgi:hypothetical protein